ncbi:hypothetical protein TeGR_g9546 [Tetraparma gracilis]|uniref:Uncharacterized protein n=1 Tax=Tetraparma gracilis TaxID=2962635 RepID=A0ABQ6MU48_9STRA|nr:hypothetical protein TeGR_g9546 [Tetraparma gracilis]
MAYVTRSGSIHSGPPVSRHPLVLLLLVLLPLLLPLSLHELSARLHPSPSAAFTSSASYIRGVRELPPALPNSPRIAGSSRHLFGALLRVSGANNLYYKCSFFGPFFRVAPRNDLQPAPPSSPPPLSRLAVHSSPAAQLDALFFDVVATHFLPADPARDLPSLYIAASTVILLLSLLYSFLPPRRRPSPSLNSLLSFRAPRDLSPLTLVHSLLTSLAHPLLHPPSFLSFFAVARDFSVLSPLLSHALALFSSRNHSFLASFLSPFPSPPSHLPYLLLLLPSLLLSLLLLQLLSPSPPISGPDVLLGVLFSHLLYLSDPSNPVPLGSYGGDVVRAPPVLLLAGLVAYRCVLASAAYPGKRALAGLFGGAVAIHALHVYEGLN